jgi:hypothetical protein
LHVHIQNDFIFLPDKKSTLFFFPGSKVDKIVTGIAVVFSVIITIAAVITLHAEQSETVRLGLVGVFALLLAGVMVVCGAKRAEVIVGTVGYVALSFISLGKC